MTDHARQDQRCWLQFDIRVVELRPRIMEDHGFQGSFTLEFTEGTGQPGESIEGLYENALRDLAFLKGMLGN